ncbi:dipeptide ABC transporter ATP-binding protein [Labrys okinawensis]|uniref:dipeptide ABC transporter ATP-binding protein n=1 Tax=Labrys okinawensis TaxID=346911 RepID=UPI0039BD7E5E
MTTDALLTVDNLSIEIGSLAVVKAMSFSLMPGEILGIVGESGSGKSMTSRALLGILPSAARAVGSARLGSKELLSLDDRGWQDVRGSEIAMIFQNASSHLDPLQTVGSQIAAPVVRHKGLSKNDAKSKAVELLDAVGIQDPRRRARSYPHQFSGGMKQRAMIAAALGGEPKLLIADEPTTALDVTVQAKILHLLKQLNQQRGLAIMLISHDLGVIADICTRVIVMRNGEVVEQGATEDIIRRPSHSYTKLLIESQPRRPKGKEQIAPELETTPLLQVRDLAVSFQVASRQIVGGSKEFMALDGLELHLAKGESVGIVGESGSGKSTLARTIVLQNQPKRGSVELDGVSVHSLRGADLQRFRKRVQMIFQSPYDALNPRMTISDAVAEPVWRHGLASRRDAMNEAQKLLGMVELPRNLWNRKPRELSGGQCQRVGIARALALNPEMIIADEITSALDVTTQAQLLKLLKALQKERSLSILYISHDLAVVASFCQRVYVLRHGKLVESGSVTEVLNSPREDYTRELLASMVDTTAAAA